MMVLFFTFLAKYYTNPLITSPFAALLHYTAQTADNIANKLNKQCDDLNIHKASFST